MFLTP